MNEQLALLPVRLTAHLQLTLAALGLGIAVSVPAGLLAHRFRRLENPVLAVAGVIQTIPSLALLAVMVPLLAAAGVSSIGYLPALIGLLLYSLLPILRNTVTGLAGVDPAMVEAARGVGMTDGQRLLRVELPIALPVILAGIRTSAVLTVGTATLSTPVGATSLGDYIFSGLQTRNFVAVLVGCAAAAVLALALDALVRWIGESVRRRRRRQLAAALACVAAVFGWTGWTAAKGAFGGAEPPVRIGAKTFTEQYILSEILARTVQARTGREVEIVSSLGSSVVFDALRAGEIDAYVDYSGTIWATVMKRSDTASREEVLREVERYLGEEHGIVVAARLGFENTYALALPRAKAESLRVRKLSELAAVAPKLSIGGNYEFFGRPEWKSLVSTYGFAFEEQRGMDQAILYQAVGTGAVDVASAFSTDGRIAAYDLTVLEDDRAAIPPYDAMVLVSRSAGPEVIAAVETLEGAIDADRMRAMNRDVDEKGLAPANVAKSFLED